MDIRPMYIFYYNSLTNRIIFFRQISVMENNEIKNKKDVRRSTGHSCKKISSFKRNIM